MVLFEHVWVGQCEHVKMVHVKMVRVKMVRVKMVHEVVVVVDHYSQFQRWLAHVLGSGNVSLE